MYTGIMLQNLLVLAAAVHHRTPATRGVHALKKKKSQSTCLPSINLFFIVNERAV